ncbi:hypothetical protein FI615_002213 [Enterococcus faecium]|nr:hypothetical protein [Enterococcus faecium]EMF0115794.1 hypothetical protein [Enterococcus hirae]
MMDSWVSFLWKIILLFMAFITIIGFILLGMSLSDISNYKQHVNYAIERNGGLTDKAVKEINKYAEEHSHGEYQLTSDKMGQKIGYGQKVSYTVKCSFKLHGLPKEYFIKSVKGEAISQVRQ